MKLRFSIFNFQFPRKRKLKIKRQISIVNLQGKRKSKFETNFKFLEKKKGNSDTNTYISFFRFQSVVLTSGKSKRPKGNENQLWQGFWKVAEKKVNFREIFRGQFSEKTADFAGIFEASLAEKRLVKNGRFRELPEQILLESDWFCADLRKLFNETRRSYSI